MASKVALITGAARRIGASIARRLHEAGYNVIVHYGHSADTAEALCNELNAARPASALCLQANLHQVDRLPDFAWRAASLWDGLDVLVNNASVFQATPFHDAGEAQWDELLGVNLKAPFFLCQAAAPFLHDRRGAIVNIADLYAERPLPGYAIYSIAKAGLVAMTRALAKELAPEVRVNAVAPGAILWPEQETDSARQAEILARVPLRRMGNPEDIARAVLFLARDADYVTGQTLSVDGGRGLFI
ncbi:MAG TPA: pteridine reductase [Methylococcaceae bacterium]|nr:pteridine reductase [Methylococcaceae bacterium]